MKNIIGITGYARSGKDTIANFIESNYQYKRIGFADNVKELARQVNPEINEMLNHCTWDEIKRFKHVRMFLQDLGNGARIVLGEKVWINPVMQLAQYQNIVISDVRYLNESEAIHSNGGVVIRVIRPGVGPLNQHVSETEQDLITAHKNVINDGDLFSLFEQIKEIMKNYEK